MFLLEYGISFFMYALLEIVKSDCDSSYWQCSCQLIDSVCLTFKWEKRGLTKTMLSKHQGIPFYRYTSDCDRTLVMIKYSTTV